jgi:hypothetical protein
MYVGIMVNYKYDLNRVEDLKQDFQRSFGDVIPVGDQIVNFLDKSEDPL